MPDHCALSHVADHVKRPAWDGSELWCRKLDRLLFASRERIIGRHIRRNGDGGSTVIDTRADGQAAVIGRSACDLYPSAKPWKKQLDEGKPEPEVLSFR